MARKFCYVCAGLLMLVFNPASAGLVGVAVTGNGMVAVADDGSVWANTSGTWTPRVNLLIECTFFADLCVPKGEVASITQTPEYGAVVVTTGGTLIRGNPTSYWSCMCEGVDVFTASGVTPSTVVNVAQVGGAIFRVLTETGDVIETRHGDIDARYLGNIFGAPTAIPSATLGQLKTRWR